MLKRKITRDAYDALSDVLKAEYKSNGDGFVLDVDDAAELLEAKNNANRERDTALATVNDLKQKLKDATTELAAAKASGGDFTATENSYKSKIANLEAQLGEANTALTKANRTITCGPIADKIAAAFTVPALVREKIMERLDIDPKTGEAFVKDVAGKKSASTPDDLRKEFVDNPDYKAIVVASKASGSADAGKSPGGSAPNSQQTDKPLARMSPQELAAHMEAKQAATT